MMVVMVVGVLPHILLKNPASLYKVHTDTTPHLLRLFVTVTQSPFVSDLLCVFGMIRVHSQMLHLMYRRC